MLILWPQNHFFINENNNILILRIIDCMDTVEKVAPNYSRLFSYIAISPKSPFRMKGNKNSNHFRQ
jgi:hypothetical protein